MWVRIDNRLVHGQIIESWLPYTNSKYIWVVDEELINDPLRQEIMAMAIPDDIHISFTSPKRIVRELKKQFVDFTLSEILVLFSNCPDARRAYENGLRFTLLNVANIHYSRGRIQICEHVALNKEDISCMNFFKKKGVNLDFRCVPNKSIHVRPVW